MYLATPMSDEIMWCKHCGPEVQLKIEFRDEVKPSIFPLSGNPTQFTTYRWPYAICNSCKRECQAEAYGRVKKRVRLENGREVWK